jgi:uncharacterized coiled-coil DUF342 family protein
MASNYTLQLLEQIDSKLDEIEELIQKLPLNPAVREQLVNRVYDFWTEIEETVDLAPTDWTA